MTTWVRTSAAVADLAESLRGARAVALDTDVNGRVTFEVTPLEINGAFDLLAEVGHGDGRHAAQRHAEQGAQHQQLRIIPIRPLLKQFDDLQED